MTTDPADTVRRLASLWKTDVEVAGGKGANLAALAAAGLPVQPGFVVTTAAYRDLVDSPAIRNAVTRLDTLEPGADELATVAAELRASIRERAFDGAVEAAIRDAVTALDGSDGFAVRSSATAEDLPSASFAGQHETYLGVSEADVVDRVRDCMVSLFTDRAVVYRARNGVSHTEAAMAVLVQPMVDATAAGVLFTADPASGNRHLSAVDASFGLGESVVAGEVTPDHALVDTRSDEVLDYTVGTKSVAVELGNDGDHFGTKLVALPPDRQESRVLSDDQLRTLVGFGQRAASLLEAPQDVEWALADGRFVLLQSRPITSLFPCPSPAPTDGRLHAYVSMGHMQAMPEAMPPLVRDVWHAYTGGALSELGLAGTLDNASVEAGGRVYIDVTPFLHSPTARRLLVGRIAAISEPIADGLAALLERRAEAFDSRGTTVAALPRYLGTVGRSVQLLGPALPRIVSNLVRALAGRYPEPDDAVWASFGDQFARPVTELSTPEARARAVFDGVDVRAIVREAYPRISPLFLAFGLGGWLDRRFPEYPDDVNAVGRGFECDVVTRINLGLGDLADVAREHPAVAEALRDGASLTDLDRVEGGDAFQTAFASFLDEFGHRGAGEIDLSRPRWREDPSMLLAVVRANLAAEDGGDHHERIRRLTEEAAAAAERLEASADHGALGPLRRRYVRWLVRTYRETVYLREYPKQEAARAFTAWRRALLDAGERLADEGLLVRPDDVWYLRKGELFAAFEGESVGVDIGARRREHERYAAMDAPPVLTSEGETVRGGEQPDGAPEGALLGTGVSAGVVEGVARVVRDPVAATVERGEILVARSTDPGWTPLFLNAAGLVSEVGGPVSHGALVAREYGLPAVVSVAEATSRIRTGQRIRIDGSRGTVEVLEDGG